MSEASDFCTFQTEKDMDWCPVEDAERAYAGDICTGCGRQWGIDWESRSGKLAQLSV